MIKKVVLGIPILLVLAIGSLAAQQNSPSAGQDQGHRGMGGPPPVLGTITSVGVDRFEIKTTDGGTQTVMVNDQTHLRQRREGQQQPQELQLEDLKVGDHVMVRGTPGSDKQVVAVGVNRLTPEQFQRFQSSPAGGGPGGPGGGWGPGGGQMEGTRAGGEITAIKGNEITVQNRRSGERVIVVNDQTTFNKEGQTVTLKDLKVGDHIFAMGKEVDGKFVATEVHSGRPGGGGRGGWQGGPQN
jgi:hypothetical protein